MRPLIVGIGGSLRAGSNAERALLIALRAAEESGARTVVFNGAFLSRIPLYVPESGTISAERRELVDTVRSAAGLIVASPSYHGSISGLVKNALDVLEDLRSDRRPYLEGRAVGCIVTATGWQAVGSAIASLRSVVHALRGWPTPLAAGLNTSEALFDDAGSCTDQHAAMQLHTVGRQVVEFAMKWGDGGTGGA